MFSGSILTHALFQMEVSWFSLSHRNTCMPTTPDHLRFLHLFLLGAYDTVVSLWQVFVYIKETIEKVFQGNKIIHFHVWFHQTVCITSRWLNKICVSSFNRQKITNNFGSFKKRFWGLTSMSLVPQGNCLFIMPVITICAAAQIAYHIMFLLQRLQLQLKLSICLTFIFLTCNREHPWGFSCYDHSTV